MPSEGWKKLSNEEVRLARRWYDGEKLKPSEIAERLGRSKCSITRLLVQQKPRLKQGAPDKLSLAKVDFLEKRMDEMVVEAKCRYHVTAAKLKHNTRTKASIRTIQRAFRGRNIYFRKLREKSTLTKEDGADRFRFAKKFKSKTKAWWNANIHAFIDGKRFTLYLNGKTRVCAAQHATYGAYRKPGKGLCDGYVKPSKQVKHNSGNGSVLVMAGVCRGRVAMWHYVAGGKWSGKAAADMYNGPLRTALAKTWPARKSWDVLEDNDPTGFKSRRGHAAKAAAGITPFVIPCRSPDLSLCDYALWKEVNRRLRRQEFSWPAGKTESRAAYAIRLKRTALRLPKAFLERSVGDMVRRCNLLHAAKGYHFEEGH